MQAQAPGSWFDGGSVVVGGDRAGELCHRTMMRAYFATRSLLASPSNGDHGAAWLDADGTLTAALVDGLGHGAGAEEAALAALAYVEANRALGLVDLVAGCDREIQATRGVALALLRHHPGQRQLAFVGVGNIVVVHVQADGRVVHVDSDPGIVGGGYRQVRVCDLVVTPRDLVVVHTDGIDQRIDLARYVPADRYDPQSLVDRLLADWATGRDDAGLLLLAAAPVGGVAP